MTEAKIIPIIGSNYPKVVIPALKEAKTQIWAMMYEWKWYGYEKAGGVQEINNIIVYKKKLGLSVQILLNIESMGHAITKINSRTASFFQKAGIDVKFGQIGVATHAKLLILDQKIAVVGSHNFTKGAFTRNQEVSVLIDGSEAIRPFIDYFKLLWQRF